MQLGRVERAMACYTFHVLHNGRAERFERLELASAHDARAMAQAFAGEMLKHGDPSVFDSDLRVRVTTPDDLTLFEILVVGTDAAAAKRPLATHNEPFD